MPKLVRCVACENRIGENADTCPNCGEPNGRILHLKKIRERYKCSLEEAIKILDRKNLK